MSQSLVHQPEMPTSTAGDGGRPQHVAIIMDGNRRWSRDRGLPILEGYRRGIETLKEVVRAAAQHKIAYLSVWAFATENWKRPAQEVSGLMGLMRLVLKRDLAELHHNGIRLQFIGDRTRLERDLVQLMENAEALTTHNTGITLIVAFNYGFRDDMTRAVQGLAAQVAQGLLAPDQITSQKIAQALATGAYPDPDLLIRTSGEQRLSDYMLWELAYTEIYFTTTHWPDFRAPHFADALKAFSQRQRRFGGGACLQS